VPTDKIQSRRDYYLGYSEENNKTWIEILFWFVFLGSGALCVLALDALIKYKESIFTLAVIALVIFFVSLGIHFNCYSASQTCFDWSGAFIRPWR
jgi:hypothetical protein